MMRGLVQAAAVAAAALLPYPATAHPDAVGGTEIVDGAWVQTIKLLPGLIPQVTDFVVRFAPEPLGVSRRLRLTQCVQTFSIELEPTSLVTYRGCVNRVATLNGQPVSGPDQDAQHRHTLPVGDAAGNNVTFSFWVDCERGPSEYLPVMTAIVYGVNGVDTAPNAFVNYAPNLGHKAQPFIVKPIPRIFAESPDRKPGVGGVGYLHRPKDSQPKDSQPKDNQPEGNQPDDSQSKDSQPSGHAIVNQPASKGQHHFGQETHEDVHNHTQQADAEEASIQTPRRKQPSVLYAFYIAGSILAGITCIQMLIRATITAPPAPSDEDEEESTSSDDETEKLDSSDDESDDGSDDDYSAMEKGNLGRDSMEKRSLEMEEEEEPTTTIEEDFAGLREVVNMVSDIVAAQEREHSSRS